MKKKFHNGTWYIYWDDINVKEFPTDTDVYIIAPEDGAIYSNDHRQLIPLFANLFSSSDAPTELHNYLSGSDPSVPVMRDIMSFLPSVIVDMSNMNPPEGLFSSAIAAKTPFRGSLEKFIKTYLGAPNLDAGLFLSGITTAKTSDEIKPETIQPLKEAIARITYLNYISMMYAQSFLNLYSYNRMRDHITLRSALLTCKKVVDENNKSLSDLIDWLALTPCNLNVLNNMISIFRSLEVDTIKLYSSTFRHILEILNTRDAYCRDITRNKPISKAVSLEAIRRKAQDVFHNLMTRLGSLLEEYRSLQVEIRKAKVKLENFENISDFDEDVKRIKQLDFVEEVYIRSHYLVIKLKETVITYSSIPYVVYLGKVIININLNMFLQGDLDSIRISNDTFSLIYTNHKYPHPHVTETTPCYGPIGASIVDAIQAKDLLSTVMLLYEYIGSVDPTENIGVAVGMFPRLVFDGDKLKVLTFDIANIFWSKEPELDVENGSDLFKAAISRVKSKEEVLKVDPRPWKWTKPTDLTFKEINGEKIIKALVLPEETREFPAKLSVNVGLVSSIPTPVSRSSALRRLDFERAFFFVPEDKGKKHPYRSNASEIDLISKLITQSGNEISIEVGPKSKIPIKKLILKKSPIVGWLFTTHAIVDLLDISEFFQEPEKTENTSNKEIREDTKKEDIKDILFDEYNGESTSEKSSAEDAVSSSDLDQVPRYVFTNASEGSQ